MPRQESATSIRDWIEEETRHIDMVASWESLCDTYEALRFTDRLADGERLEEFKWIVQQMNSFLTKVRTRLLSCKDREAMLEMLRESCATTGKETIGTRKALVYQKLRQQWMMTTMARLGTMLSQEETEEQDGWRD